jgi:hypothetical protein
MGNQWKDLFDDSPSPQQDQKILRMAEDYLRESKRSSLRKSWESLFLRFSVPALTASLALVGFWFVRDSKNRELAADNLMLDWIDSVADGSEELLSSEEDLDIYAELEELELLTDEDLEDS